jgi:serine/threonine protein kinase
VKSLLGTKSVRRIQRGPLAHARGLSRTKLRNERDVEMYFVPNFLTMLGYRFPRDIQNAPALESPEYYVGTRKRTSIFPDHLVFVDDRIAFVLEVKKPSAKLGTAEIGQVLSYALHPDIQADLAVLTNGVCTIIIHARRREPILQIDQRDLLARLPDLQLLLGRKSLSRRVGELVAEKRMGRGGFGTVYKAWNITLQRYEALKIYHTEVTATAASRRRLVNGLRAQAQLHHENIAQIYQIQNSDAEVLAAMQFSSGVTFDRWTKTDPGARQKIQVLSHVAKAIHFAHEHGVVHRDLKPSNLLIERQGRSWRPLIVDFDTAVVIESTRFTQTSDTIGTLGFMAPEMFSSPRSSRLKKRSPLVDVYSLGALAFNAFFGTPPKTIGARTLKADNLIKRVRDLKEAQARKLVVTILRAMDPEPGIRQQTALDLANDLEEVLSASPGFDTSTEHEFVDALFREADRLLREEPLPGLKSRPYEKSSQLGHLFRVPGFGDLILMHDFDYRELMTGYTFVTVKQFNAFSASPVVKRLRKEFGKNLVVDPPNPWEEGGAYVMWRLSEIIRKRPAALAQEAVGILRTFYRCLGVSAPSGKTTIARQKKR